MLHSERPNQTVTRVLRILVLVYQGIALLAFIGIPFLAIHWVQTPFLGAFVEQTMVFDGVGQDSVLPQSLEDLFQDKSLWLKYQLVNVNGVAVQNAAQVQAALADSWPGQTLPVVLRHLTDGQTEIRPVTLQSFPASARTVYFVIPYIVGLLFLGISLWIFGLRRAESAGRAFAVLSTSVAIACAGLFDLYTTHWLSLLWTLSLACAGGAMIDLALVFRRKPVGPPSPIFAFDRLCARLAAVYSGRFQYLQLAYPHRLHYQLAFHIYPGWSVGDLLCRHVALSARSSPLAGGTSAGRCHLIGDAHCLWTTRSLVIGDRCSIPAQLPAGLHWLAVLFSRNFPTYLLLLTVLFPLVVGYSILRYRLLRTDLFFRHGVFYAVLTVLALGGYTLLVSGLTLIFGKAFQVTNPIFIGLLVFILALGLKLSPPLAAALRG